MVIPYVKNHRSGVCGNPEEKTNSISRGMILLTGVPGYGKTKLLGHIESTTPLGQVIYVDFSLLNQQDYPALQGFVNYFQTVLNDNPAVILIDHPWAYDIYMDALEERIIKPHLDDGGKVVVACRRKEDNPFSIPYQEIKLTPWTKDGRDEYCRHRAGSFEAKQYEELYGNLSLHIPHLVANGLNTDSLEKYFRDVFESFIEDKVLQEILPYLAVVSCVKEPSDVNRMLENIQTITRDQMNVEEIRSVLRNSGVIQGTWDSDKKVFSFDWNKPLQYSLQVWLKMIDPPMYSEIMKKGE